jgi:hypothetical protein
VVTLCVCFLFVLKSQRCQFVCMEKFKRYASHFGCVVVCWEIGLIKRGPCERVIRGAERPDPHSRMVPNRGRIYHWERGLGFCRCIHVSADVYVGTYYATTMYRR